ncbi:hypothetical protein K2P97_08655 [bacterium]|nr:hypothetical protein [bacterium]
MIKHLVSLIIIFSYQNVFAAAELLVKDGTVSISGYSAIQSDLTIVYGGIAGNACAASARDGINTCNSCIDAGGAINACNQQNVYDTLKLRVSFKPTKAVTGVAQLFIEGPTTGDFGTPTVSLASAAYTEASTVTLETTWSTVCVSAGLNSSCVGSSPVLATKGMKFGLDSDGNGTLEDAERKSLNIKFHYIPAGAPNVTQAQCTSGNGIGMCNISFIPGDAKAFIDTAIYSGADSGSTTAGGSVDWESIAIFPVATTAGSEANVYTNFGNGVVQPIFKNFEATGASAGSIPDSQVSGGMSNYQLYCMVYATKNKTQNIYKFVTTGVTTAKSCVTPSEVVGLLDDKHCFISTAAFGSESAPEVEVFRKFRNKFLVKNSIGRQFIKFYYKVSPPIADVISGNNYLKGGTRVVLYPFLIFASLSLKIGIILTSILMLLVLLGSWYLAIKMRKRHMLTMILVLLLSPTLKAEIVPDETTMNHPKAKQGLVRIKKDGTYIYDTERQLKKESSHIRFGQANQPEISISIEQTNASGQPTGTYNTYQFKDFYDSDSGLIVGYDYEWFPWVGQGKLGVQAGASAMFVSGHGRLVATPNAPSAESFNFVTMPITLGAVYRLEWKDKQMFAPYASGGGTYVVLIEKREDVSSPKFAGGFGFYGSGGVMMNLGAFDRETSYSLDSEYGISNMWLSLEFKVVEVNNDSFTFSNKYLNAGLSFDF